MGTGAIGIVQVVVQYGVAGIVANAVVTQNTPSQAQLTVAEPLERLHEGLVEEAPSYGCRGEIAPALVLVELRRGVGTEVDL